MAASKKILINDMPGLYAVATVILDGEPYYAAASEQRNGLVAVVSCATDEVHWIEGGKGGVMGLMNSVKENRLLSIEEFYPGFDAAHSKIVEITLEKKDGRWQAASRKELAEERSGCADYLKRSIKATLLFIRHIALRRGYSYVIRRHRKNTRNEHHKNHYRYRNK